MPGKKRGPEHRNSKNWGGPRPNPPKKLGRPKGVERVTYSVTLPPQVKALALAIAQERGYRSWGHAVEEAVKKLAKEMGLT